MAGFLGNIFESLKGMKPHIEIETKAEPSGLESVLSALQDGIVVYDQNFAIRFFNPAAEKIFGVFAKNVLGKRITPQDIQSPERALLAQVIYPSLAPVVVTRTEAGVYPQVADLSFEDPVVELRVLTAPTVGKDGVTVGFMKIVHDRTRELTVLRSKNEFVTVASHQLRSPLTNINWALDTLAKDETLNETNREIATNAFQASVQLLAIVEDLLTIAKIEEGRFGYNFKPENLVDFVSEILSSALARAKQLGMKLYFDKPDAPMTPVMIDKMKMSMVMQNLLDNAFRYNVPNGEIYVRIEQMPSEPFVQVSVKDTGIGFSSDDARKIFTKFFRAENAVKTETEGSGLGLYVAQNVIQAHGGKMSFESEVNRGSTFTFTLPTDPSLVPQKEVPLEY